MFSYFSTYFPKVRRYLSGSAKTPTTLVLEPQLHGFLPWGGHPLRKESSPESMSGQPEPSALPPRRCWSTLGMPSHGQSKLLSQREQEAETWLIKLCYVNQQSIQEYSAMNAFFLNLFWFFDFLATHISFVNQDHPSPRNFCTSDCFSHEFGSAKVRWKARGCEMSACHWQCCSKSSEVPNSACEHTAPSSLCLGVGHVVPHALGGSEGSMHIFHILIELHAQLALLRWERLWQRPGCQGTMAGVSLGFERLLFSIKVLLQSVAASCFHDVYLSHTGTRAPRFMMSSLWFQTENLSHLCLSVVFFKCCTEETKIKQCLI